MQTHSSSCFFMNSQHSVAGFKCVFEVLQLMCGAAVSCVFLICCLPPNPFDPVPVTVSDFQKHTRVSLETTLQPWTQGAPYSPQLTPFPLAHFSFFLPFRVRRFLFFLRLCQRMNVLPFFSSGGLETSWTNDLSSFVSSLKRIYWIEGLGSARVSPFSYLCIYYFI